MGTCPMTRKLFIGISGEQISQQHPQLYGRAAQPWSSIAKLK